VERHLEAFFFQLTFYAVDAVSEECTTSLNEASVLIFTSHVQVDTFPCEEALALL
jgi:hypothetical protein